MGQLPDIYQIKFEPDLPEDVLFAADVGGEEQRICGEDILFMEFPKEGFFQRLKRRVFGA